MLEATRYYFKVERSLWLDPLEDRGDALPAADAHGNEGIPLADTLELVERLHGEDRAGRADRVSKRDRAAVRVHLGRVEPKILRHRHGLDREGFVRFDHVHVGALEPGLLEHAPHRRNRPQAHHLRLYARVGIRYEACNGLDVLPFCRL